MSVRLSFYLSIYLPIYLFVCLSVCVSTGCRSVMSWQHELVARRCRPWYLFDVPSCCKTMWMSCCLHATLFRRAVMPWSNINVDMRRFGAVCSRLHVAVLVALFACSLMTLFCLDLKLISTCVVLAPSTVDSSSSFLHIHLSFCLCIYMSACLSFYLSTYLSICLFVCVSIGCRNMTS